MTQDDWSAILDEHPIFTLPNSIGGPAGQLEESLELSTNTLRKSLLEEDGLSLSGRRQVMALKDSDLIVAAGCELRITSLSNSKLGRNTNKSFKVRFLTLTHMSPRLTAQKGLEYTKYSIWDPPTRFEPEWKAHSCSRSIPGCSCCSPSGWVF